MGKTLFQKESDKENNDVRQTEASLPTALSHAPEEKAVSALLEIAENEEQKRRLQERIHHRFGITVIASFVAITCTMIAAFYLKAIPVKSMVAWLPLLGVINSFVQFGFRNGWGIKPDRQQKAVTALLPFPNEPRRLLPLVDALRLPQTAEWKALLYPALIEGLWNLSPTDAALSLDATRRATLRTSLMGAYVIYANGKRRAAHGYFDDGTADLTVAIMKTLADLGDKKAIVVLQKIIQVEAATPNERVVRDAAREYLPVLTKKIAKREKIQQKLDQCLSESIRDPQIVLNEFLGTLPAEEAKVALVEFIHEQRRSQAFSNVFAIGAFPAMGLVIIFSALKDMAFPIICMGICFILIGFGIYALSANTDGLTKEGRKITDELNRRTEGENDLRLIPLLLAYAQQGEFLNDRYHNDAAKKSLARLLPQLKPGDAALIPPQARFYLRAWLKRPRFKKRAGSGSQTLTIIALDALAVIGDTKALPDAEQIARRTRGGTYRETELHEAALRCVEALRARKGTS